LELANGDVRLVVRPEQGGLISSFGVSDLELLRTPDDDPDGTHWGCFVMAPWAGRTRHGRFTFEDTPHQLVCDSGPHAIHGTVRHQPWTVEWQEPGAALLSCPFGPGWPFAGHAEHTIRVQPDRVAFELALHASEGPMPAIGGWHPWWRRRLTRGEPVRLALPARAMLRRDGEGITTEEQVTPIPPGPWDDCFTGFDGPPVLRWEGAIELAVESDCEWVVVYDEPVESVCVEPQSAPPDALNHGPAVATPGQPVVVHSSWRWRT
jgi:galactose mutarotase-like enzyme